MPFILDTVKTLQTDELQRAYNWEFILPQLQGAPDNIEISAYIQDVKFGDYNIADVYSQRLGAFQTFASGLMTIGTASLTMLSPANANVIKYFKAWKDLMYSTKGAYYFAKSNYAKACYCYLYDRAGNSNLQYKLVNCFPKTFPALDLSYASNEMQRLNIELVVDTVQIM